MSDLSVKDGRPLVKTFTDEEILFLRQHLPEFERLSHGIIRGAAKNFAKERAGDFIVRFRNGPGSQTDGQDEAKFKDQIYNWFKNTSGRVRRKQKQSEGQDNSKPKSNADSTTTNTVTPAWTVHQPIPPFLPPQSPYITLATREAVRDAFLMSELDARTLCATIQSFVASHPSSTPLTDVILAMFDALSSIMDSTPSVNGADFSEQAQSMLRRFQEAAVYFPATLVHAGVSGPSASKRALQFSIRKQSVWQAPKPVVDSSTSIDEEMRRMAAGRQSRKEYIQWARIHAAALQLGFMDHSDIHPYGLSRAFSEMIARDLVWEHDEVEWVAGMYILRAIIKTAAGAQKIEEYSAILSNYQTRWTDIKDEGRQAMLLEELIQAKADLGQRVK